MKSLRLLLTFLPFEHLYLLLYGPKWQDITLIICLYVFQHFLVDISAFIYLFIYLYLIVALSLLYLTILVAHLALTDVTKIIPLFFFYTWSHVALIKRCQKTYRLDIILLGRTSYHLCRALLSKDLTA